ncbi:hypothetical protein BX616_007624 [Lobosporangium transversale]|nr:hypothetical protein BX616_007624 [Lobosporangium transversale]
MGTIPSKPSFSPAFSASTPSSPNPYSARNSSGQGSVLEAPHRASFSVESPVEKEKRRQLQLQHQQSFSYSSRPFSERSQQQQQHRSSNNNNANKSQNEERRSIDRMKGRTIISPSTSTNTNTNSNINSVSANKSTIDYSETGRAEKIELSLENNHRKNTIADSTAKTFSLSCQGTHSQSSLSDKSIASISSGGNVSGNGSSGSSGDNRRGDSTPSTSISAETTESLGQLSLQRFPTGEIEYKGKTLSTRSKITEITPRRSYDAQTTTSRAVSSSARSSSGSSGFKFTKPSLSFKPLLNNHSTDNKNPQHMYQHRNNSSSSGSPNGHDSGSLQEQHQPQTPDPYAGSPFPPVLMTIKLPQSLLDKYVIDQESFRHGKGIWGIGKYSWTITVLSRANGKKLDQNELENIQEVLVIENKGRKDLPQLPSPSSQQSQKHSPSRPLSASSILTATSRELSKDKAKRKSLHLYSCHNSSMPNQQSRFLTFSTGSSPQQTPINSRPSTPSPSPSRLFPGSSVSASPSINEPGKSNARNKNQPNSASLRNERSSPHNAHSPLLPSATPLSWPFNEGDQTVSQTGHSVIISSTKQSNVATLSPPRISNGSSKGYSSPRSYVRPALMSQGNSFVKKKRAAQVLRRHASAPNLSRPLTGLDLLEDDPSRLEQLKRLSRCNRYDWLYGDSRSHHHNDPCNQIIDSHPFIPESDGPFLNSLFPLTPITPSSQALIDKDEQIQRSIDGEDHSLDASENVEMKINPLDTNNGEFERMSLESAKSKRPSEPRGFVPPQHALPMELVLLQTYNDSDHLPEHHEWTQDQDYWYYVTKMHGVRRRKLKKVSTWWLDMSSLGNALLSSSSASSEPIATGPIYNMGQGAMSISPLSSPLTSDVALSDINASGASLGVNGQVGGKELTADSSHTNLSSFAPTISTMKRQSSPRNSHMGKYYYVDWDEYTSY